MFKEVKGSKLYEQIIKQIQTQITEGVFKKGEMLPSEKELMHSTGVSRVTVRGALKALADSGIIETRQGKGSFVIVDGFALDAQKKNQRSLDAYKADFRHSMQARLLVEPEIARQVALQASAEEIEGIQKHLRIPTAQEGDPSIGPAGMFHRAIVLLLRNPLLLHLFDKLADAEINPPPASIIPPHRQKEMAAEIRWQHQKIYEALRDRNSDFAYFYMKEHTLYVAKAYEEFFQVFLS